MLMPACETDQAFLDAIADYKLGAPIASPVKTAEAIAADGYVGIYTTLENLKKPEVRAKSGWFNPERVLGQEWKA